MVHAVSFFWEEGHNERVMPSAIEEPLVDCDVEEMG